MTSRTVEPADIRDGGGTERHAEAIVRHEADSDGLQQHGGAGGLAEERLIPFLNNVTDDDDYRGRIGYLILFRIC